MAVAVQLVLGQKQVPLVTEVAEVCFNDQDWEIVPFKSVDLSSIIRVPCEDGTVFFICPWCLNFQIEGELGPKCPDGSQHRFEVNGLFWHGHCSRPNYQYTHEECGQEGYDD